MSRIRPAAGRSGIRKDFGVPAYLVRASAARNPLRTAPSMVAGQPVAVQSPARKRRGNGLTSWANECRPSGAETALGNVLEALVSAGPREADVNGRFLDCTGSFASERSCSARDDRLESNWDLWNIHWMVRSRRIA